MKKYIENIFIFIFKPKQSTKHLILNVLLALYQKLKKKILKFKNKEPKRVFLQELIYA